MTTELPGNLPEAWRLAEDECNALRVCLAWAGARLSPAHRAEFAQMIRDKMIVKDGREEEREELRKIEGLCLRMGKHLRIAVHKAQGTIPMPGGGDWFAIAEGMASRAAEFEAKPRRVTLLEIRNIKEGSAAADAGKFFEWADGVPPSKDSR